MHALGPRGIGYAEPGIGVCLEETEKFGGKPDPVREEEIWLVGRRCIHQLEAGSRQSILLGTFEVTLQNRDPQWLVSKRWNGRTKHGSIGFHIHNVC